MFLLDSNNYAIGACAEWDFMAKSQQSNLNDQKGL